MTSDVARIPSRRIRSTVLLCALALAACQLRPVAPVPSAAQEALWESLHALCGQAYAGRVAVDSAADPRFKDSALVMHVTCTGPQVRIPFHVGEDRSRTWVLTRTLTGLRLKHDHRHPDGSEDAVTQYGGDTRGPGSATAQDFHADAHTAALLPAAATNIWTVEVVPGQRFAYALRREGTDRRFRVEFDLTRPVAPPPPPWGS